MQMDAKRNKRRIIFSSIVAFIIVALLVGVLYYMLKPDKGSKLDTLEVAKGTVIQTLEKTAAVSSNEKGDFVLVDGVVVKTVNVKVGQTVKKGDVLATFDTSSLQKIVDEKEDAYNTAKIAYDKYLSSAANSSSQLAGINKEIAETEAKIKALEKKVEENKNNTKPEIPEDATTEQKTEIEKLKDALNKLIDDTVLSSKLIQLILKNSESAQQVIDALKGVINSMGGTTGSADMSQLKDFLESAMAGISKEQTELIEAQLKLAELKTKKATLSVSSDDSLKSVYKKLTDSAYNAYLTAKNTVDSVSKGWIAEYDGIVSKVDIEAGQKFGKEGGKSSGGLDIAAIIESLTSGNADISSLFSGFSTESTSALTVEYFPLTASFTLGKTEMSKVEVGQKVDIVLGSDETVTGTVVYKSAVATEANGLDISSVLGGSATSSGIEVRVDFDEYNSNVIIGFDVEVSIKTDQSEDTVVVPIESIQYENSKAYVYKYDAEEKTIVKTEVTIGLRDDLKYEILSGCEVGDIIVKSPTSTLKDGQRIQSNLIGKTAK